MDTVIKEIANQLGMAVDQAGQFIVEQLPNFAAMKTMQLSTQLIIMWLLTALLFVIAIVFLIITKKHRDYDLTHDSIRYSKTDRSTDWEYYSTFSVFVYVGILFIVSFVVSIAFLFNYLPLIIGWINYPEAMLINMALQAAV